MSPPKLSIHGVTVLVGVHMTAMRSKEASPQKQASDAHDTISIIIPQAANAPPQI
jgi:hypothetical protein